jgi:DegV family protein with EDD domain
VVTDSTSDVPERVAHDLGITVVPAYVQIGGRSLRDRVELSREQFYARLAEYEEVPTTAVPPIDDFARAYRDCAVAGDEIVAVLVSERLSGMCNAARVAARQTPDLRVTVVDSGQVSMGLGWQVIGAAEAAAEGGDASEVVTRALQVRSRIRLYAVLDTLDFLRRSGRVSWAAAEASRILRIKPILSVADGVVDVVGRTRTRRRALVQIARWTREAAPIERLAVLHTVAPEIADFRDSLSDLAEPEAIETILVTTAIGTHTGAGAMGIAAVVAS